MTEHPAGEPEVITAPTHWNMIVSSSLTGQTGVQQVAPSRLSHRHGYVVDAGEGSDVSVDHGSPDGLLQHQDSPSRLGIAIDYDLPLSSNSKKAHKVAVPATAEASSEYAAYDDYGDYSNPASSNKTGAPPPYGVNLGDIPNDSNEAAASRDEPSGTSSEHELEGFGAAFPELIGNGIRPKASTIPTTKRPVSRVTATSVTRPGSDVRHTVVDQAIDAFDKKFKSVEVDSSDMPLNTTTIPERGVNLTSGSGLTYLLIGVLGGLSLLFFCAVGLTIRCRKRRFQFATFTTMIRRGLADEESSAGSPTPNSIASRRIANQQAAAAAANSKEAEAGVSTHKLGSWFTGRNSMSSLHSQTGGTARKLRSEMALPTSLSTVGTNAGKRIVTRAYFTDGRTGSTRDLVTSGTSSEASGSTPGTPGPLHHQQSPDRKSWLHTSYTKERGHSLRDLRDASFYCIASAAAPDASSDDGERPRSASATVRSPVHHFRSSSSRTLQDSLESTPPPDLPPKRRTPNSSSDLITVDPMGSRLTVHTDAETGARSDVGVSYWGAASSVEDRLI